VFENTGALGERSKSVYFPHFRKGGSQRCHGKPASPAGEIAYLVEEVHRRVLAFGVGGTSVIGGPLSVGPDQE